MSEPVPLLVVGGGNMGAALVGGLIDAGVYEPSSITVVEVIEARRDELRSSFSGVTVVERVTAAEGAVIAVKPPDVARATRDAVDAGARRVVSIAAGVTLATLSEAAGPDVAVVRAMPNTPALVGLGASALAAGAGTSAEDLAWATSILGAVGIVEHLDERQLDAFTGVAGSGPAYLFLVAEALIDAAVANGMARAVAERVVAQLLLGSAALLDQQGDAARLRANVTSPGGTTAAGLARLEERAVRSAFAAAVDAATARSRELG